MTNSLDKLTIRGFKSIRELDGLELKNLNILIGANGAGKSNLIAFFQMLKAQADGALKSYITLNGGIEDLLHKGPRTCKQDGTGGMLRFRFVQTQHCAWGWRKAMR